MIAYVIMPDHLHLVAWPPPGTTTGRVMKMIKGRFARKYRVAHGKHGTFWQSRYHEEAVTSDESLQRAVDYVHHNPVAAGMVQDPSDYPWSTASLPSHVRLKPDPREPRARIEIVVSAGDGLVHPCHATIRDSQSPSDTFPFEISTPYWYPEVMAPHLTNRIRDARHLPLTSQP